MFYNKKMQIEDFNLADNTHWRLYKPENAIDSYAVLWLQGFTSTIDGHVDGCTRLSSASNVHFAMLNYAGHGDHPIKLKDATRKTQFNEVCAVYDELVKLGFSKIIVIGVSFGAYMAALLASVRKPQAIVLRAPANYMEEEFHLPYSETIEGNDKDAKNLYRQSITSDYSNNAVEAIREFNGTVYVIQNEKDSVINPTMPKSYYNAAKNGNYILIPGLDHSPMMMENPQAYMNIIERWLQTIIYAIVNAPDKDN